MEDGRLVLGLDFVLQVLQVLQQVRSPVIFWQVFLEVGLELLEVLVLAGRLLLEVGLLGLVAEDGALQQSVVPRVGSLDGHFLAMLASSLAALLKR